MDSRPLIPFLVFVIQCLLFLSSSVSLFASALCQNDQRLALLHFKQSFDIDTDPEDYCVESFFEGVYNSYGVQDSYPKTNSWNSSIDCCLWDGVTCDESTGHVIELDLSCSRLSGTIDSNSSLFYLSHLRKLNLAYNQINGSFISHKFRNFSYMTHLNLSNSELSGQIPSEVIHLPNLISLDLSFLYSDLKIENHDFKFLLQNSTQLRELVLDGISIHSTIPPNVSSLITTLSLCDTELQGSLPSNIFHLPSLQTLSLQGNENLIIHFPSTRWNSSSALTYLDLGYTVCPPNIIESLANLSRVKSLGLANCGLSGKVPETILNLDQLTALDLSDNNLKGGFADLFVKLWRLKKLFLDDNNITSHFPSSITNITQLQVLSLSNNSLCGTLPSWLFNISTLYELDLRYNQLQGSIPSSLSKHQNLFVLDLSWNNLSGTVEVNTFSNLKRIGWLSLSNNRLSIVTNTKINSTSWSQNLVALELSSCNLTDLSFLRDSKSLVSLDLSNNKIQDLSFLRDSKSLRDLNLSNNKIQYLSFLRDLKFIWHLDLSNNKIQDLSFLRDSKSLRDLDLSNNKIQDLSFLRDSKSLWNLDLSNNKIQDLSFLRDLKFIWHLDLSNNKIQDLSFLRDSKSLEFLDLSNNKIQGRIPEWAWSNWRDNLMYLNLSYNSLTSVEGIQLLSLQVIDLGFNLLEGPLPIPSSPYLEYLFASENKFSGELPLTLCNLSSVSILDLANNNLTGAIPQCLWNASEFLEVLDMHNNEFGGSIPTTFFVGNQRLHTLNLRGNKLEGRIPRSLANCTKLEVLDLGNNYLSDVFPEWLVTLPELQVLSLRSNKLHGTITTSTTQHLSSKLKIIDLSHNQFTGHLPVWLFKSLSALQNTDDERKPRSYFGDERNYYKDSLVLVVKGNELTFDKILTVYTTIDLSSNKFEGNIPGAIGQLVFLRGLNLSHNMLCGSIPHSLGNLNLLESLDLSSNQLVGEIPNELETITFLSVLNLSHNHLTGCIPKGKQFNTFENDSYQGNDGLLGYPVTQGCGNGDSSKPPTPQEHKVSILDGFTWKAVLLGYGCGVVFGLVVGSLMLLIGKPYWITRIVEEEGYKMMMKAKKKRSKTPRK